MGSRVRAVLVAALLAIPAGAAAQPPLSARWDTGASFGIVWGGGYRQDDPPYDYDDPNRAYQFDLGRYWTTHLKTDFAAVLTPRDHNTVYTPLPGVPAGYAYARQDDDLTTLAGSIAYQFFENEMAHPYVAGGVQVGYLREHRYRDQQTYALNRVSYVVPALDERSSELLVRPFVAVGAKSYFNRQTFVRSELIAAVSSHGFSHAAIRLGLGVDF